MKVLNPKDEYVTEKNNIKHMFLAGSIDNGSAIKWQDRVIKDLFDKDICIMNPRNENWNKDLVQSVLVPEFNNQLLWELHHLNIADVVMFYFDENGKAPITLLEMGLMVSQDKTVLVCCGPDYWRRGNVEIVCKYYNIPFFEKYSDIIAYLKVIL